MKKRLLVLAMTLGLSMAVLTGCGTPTVEDLVDGMYETEADSLAMEMNMAIGGEASTEGISMTLDLGMDMNLEAMGLSEDAEEGLGHANIAMDVDLEMEMAGYSDGMTESFESEMYTVKDGDTYVYDPELDVWYINEDSDGDDITGSVDEVNEVVKELWYAAEMAEETEEVDGEECYVLSMTVAGEDMANVWEAAGGAVDMDDFIDEDAVDMDALFEELSLDFVAYFSTDTKEIVRMEATLGEVDFDALLEAAGVDMSELAGADMDLEISTFDFSMVVSGYNNTEVEMDEDIADEAISYDEYEAMSASTGVPEIEVEPVEPEVDPVVPEVEPSTGGAYGDTIDLYNVAYDYLATVYCPDGYYIDESYSDSNTSTPQYVNIIADDYSVDVRVGAYVTDEMMFYLNDGTVPAGYDDYSVTYEEMDPVAGGQDCYFAVESYDGYSYYYVIIPYPDPRDTSYSDFLNLYFYTDPSNMSMDEIQQVAYDIFGY